MKVLLTGGSGMVGRNIVEHPLANQFDIRTPTSSELDLRNKRAVADYLAVHRPDLIIHAAGKVGGITANVDDPYGFLLENLELGTNIISAAVDAGVKNLLNLGSSCIYPRDVDGLLTEALILTGQMEPTNEGYALAKVTALRLCQFASSRLSGAQYKTLIPCNLFGKYDKFDLHIAHLIPAIIHKIHRAKIDDRPTVEIWGDGSARREFMYAADLADAVLRGAIGFDSLPGVMNVGLGRDHTVLEYYQAVAKTIGWHGEFTFDLAKPTGMRRKLVDVTLQSDWGWGPSTSLESGIRATYDYFLRTHCP